MATKSLQKNTSFIFNIYKRILGRLYSLFSVKLDIKKIDYKLDLLGLIRDFSIIFSEGANTTIRIPKSVLNESLSNLGLESSRLFAITNRALWKNKSFKINKTKIFSKLLKICNKEKNEEAEAILRHVNSLSYGNKAEVITKLNYTVIPNDSSAFRIKGRIYTFAQGSCVVVGLWAENNFFLAHYQKHLLQELSENINFSLDKVKRKVKSVHIISNDIETDIKSLQTICPAIFKDNFLWVHDKKRSHLTNYNLKVSITSKGPIFYKSSISPKDFYQHPYLRHGYEMAFPFDKEHMSFDKYY